MTELDDAALDAIEARANAATDGPWEVDRYWWKPRSPAIPDQWMLGILGEGDEICAVHESDDGSREDAEFIAHARTDVPALVTALRAEREATEALGGMFEWQAEVIIDTRDALRTRREEWYGGSRVRPRMMIPTDIDAVLAILDRERNADPSRYDKACAERDAAIARADAAEAAIAAVRALLAHLSEPKFDTDFMLNAQFHYARVGLSRALDTGATT